MSVPFRCPVDSYFQINGSIRGVDGSRMEWEELAKGRSWDDSGAERTLIDLRIYPDRQERAR